MASILVVCTGNVCRSPLAEGFLRHALAERLRGEVPEVSSAGTVGWDGSGAMPESVRAGAERGLDVSSHVARRLTAEDLERTDLMVGMAREHREAAAELHRGAASRSFTLKELVRLLDELPADLDPASPDIVGRVGAAAELRRNGFSGNEWDEDVVDPLGMPLSSYRAVAWELQEWTQRLADGLVGTVPVPAGGDR